MKLSRRVCQRGSYLFWILVGAVLLYILIV
jgi:hypothetical protein